jgi:putative spermidine/putrescine transport system permease protein
MTPAATAPMRSQPPLAPYLLSAPALLLYAMFLLVPLVATALLSLHSFSLYKGIEDVYNLANYRDIFGDSYFYEIFARTFRIAFLVTVLAALIGAPEAYILNRMRAPWRGIFLLVALAPLLVSVISRTLGWALLFGSTGLVNQALMGLGVASGPLQFMYSETGIVIALTHVLMPFMMISVWASLQRLDPAIEHAAVSLGAASFTVLRRIVLPQALPGVLSGGIITFALAASAFATPAIIGGRRLKVVSTLAYDEFLNTLNWPLGAAIAVLLLVANIVIILGCNKLLERRYAEVFR